MTRAQILKKIRKLLALSASANEHEAAAALAKAQALMEEHQLAESDVELADIETAAGRRRAAARPTTWEVNLMFVIAGVFGVEYYLDGPGTVRFVGVGANAEIAQYAWTTLYRLLIRQRAAYLKTKLRRCKAGTKRARADYFCKGWVSGVEIAVICLVPERRECPLAKQWIAENLSLQSVAVRKPGNTKSRAIEDDYWNGHFEGEKVKLNHGLGASGPDALLRIGNE